MAESGLFAGSSAPAYMRRSGQAERLGGRCGRMRVRRVAAFVIEGEGMGMRRSGIELAKRIIRAMGGAVGSVEVKGAIEIGCCFRVG